jgi:two-component system nitrate/nitrite response regulator NarL
VADTRLLIVDDSAEIRSLLREIADALDYRVVGEAENGKEALSMVPDLGPDVVLLDISMPVMGGFEAARKLQKLAPELPIIFISQHSGSEYEDEAFRAGGKGYVLKSAIASELREAIECVRNHQTYRSARRCRWKA